MLLVHFSDLHLGHRAYERSEDGGNVRERDVAAAFQRAMQEVIRLKPDLVLLVGDIFDRPDPPPGALVTLAQGLEALRSGIPAAQVFMVAGARDTPRPMSDPGALAALDPFPNVEAVTGRPRSVFLKNLETHLFLVPHSAVIRRPFPELRIHPDARWNLLLAYAGVATGAGPGLHLDPGPWDYVALGYLHQHQQVAPNVFYPGSLERVGPEPWREAAQEKGFLSFDLNTGTSRFHPIPGRPVVALAPIRIPRTEAAKLRGKVREVLGEVPGGIQGKIVRLRIEGLTPREVRKEAQGLFGELRKEALHLAIEVDDFQSLADDNPLPLVARDRGFALRALRDRVKEEDGGEALSALLEECVQEDTRVSGGRGMEEELLLRELHGSALPYLGRVSMEAEEGLLGWMGGDGRTLRAFISTLLWGMGIRSELPGQAEKTAQGEASLSLRMGGIPGGRFWRRTGSAGLDREGAEDAAVGVEWGLPAERVSLAWCGDGADSPEDVVEGGEGLLAAARGVQELDRVLESLEERYPALKRDRSLGSLTALDYERLMLESELADLRSQLRALEDVPRKVNELEGELLDLRGTITEVSGELGAGNMEWHRERQDAETHLLAYRDRARELRTRIRKLEDLGPDSPCPTCGRLLEDHFQEVLEELRDEWEALVQDGQWWRRRWEQLEERPQELKELENRQYLLNARFEDCTERLERARSSLREMDELRVRRREAEGRLELVLSQGADSSASPEDLEAFHETHAQVPEAPPAARTLYDLTGGIREEILDDARTRLMNRAGRRLNRLTGGRLLGLGDGDDSIELVDGGASAGVEADEDRAASMVALRMALAEILAEDWNPLGSFILGDPFDRMGAEDQLRALSLFRRLLSRIPQVFILTRGSVVERAPEFFDGLYDYRRAPEDGEARGSPIPAGVGQLHIR